MNWRPVASANGAYANAYEVSDEGVVRSLDRVNHYGRSLSGQILKPYQGKQRMLVKLSVNGVSRSFAVHRLVLEAFVGPCPDGMEGCHNDGDFQNNNIENLRWDTSSNNGYDTVRHGRHYRASSPTCCRGHLLQEPNLTEKGRGRQCRSCNAGRSAFRKGRVESVERYADLFYARLLSGGVESRRGGDRRSAAARGSINYDLVKG